MSNPSLFGGPGEWPERDRPMPAGMTFEQMALLAALQDEYGRGDPLIVGFLSWARIQARGELSAAEQYEAENLVHERKLDRDALDEALEAAVQAGVLAENVAKALRALAQLDEEQAWAWREEQRLRQAHPDVGEQGPAVLSGSLAGYTPHPIPDGWALEGGRATAMPSDSARLVMDDIPILGPSSAN